MPLPTWVLKRDGRQEAFEADKISQALFAATEALGAPNAFLARELTDGALHFLAQEASDHALPTTQIADLVEKVVRELGQPAVAQAFAQAFAHRAHPARAARPQAEKPVRALTCAVPLTAPPHEVVRTSLEAYTLQAVFGRDLAAAHAEGLIALCGLTSPGALASIVIDGAGPAAEPGWQVGLRQVEQAAAPRVVVDSAERYLQHHGADWLIALDRALAFQNKEAILNVNSAVAPRWAQDAEGGPLFPGGSASAAVSAQEVLQILLRLKSPRLRVDWHLQGSDFDDAARRRVLHDVLVVHDAARCAFVMDRPRQPVHLAEGVDRDRSGALLEVGLNLPSFLRRPDVDGDAQRFLAKLPSLARMAVRAGAQKRKYLRHQGGDLGRGFLLDRAALVVTPLGLDAVVQSLLNQSCARSPRSLDFAQEIVAKLMDQLQADGRAAHLDVVLDSPCAFAAVADGLPCSDPGAAPEDQLRAAAALQRLAMRGTAVIHVPKDFGLERRLELLEKAWRDGGIVRLRFVATD
jgi:hypothetical protein